MERQITLAAVVTKWGVRLVSTALLGDATGELLGEISGALFGLIKKADQEQDQLRNLTADVLRLSEQVERLSEQRYLVAQESAVRYLSQAMLGGRKPEARERDLDTSERLLIEAAHAATNPFQRALSERLLILVRLSVGDMVGARHASELLDICIGQCGIWMKGWQSDETRPSPILASVAADAIGAEPLIGGGVLETTPRTAKVSGYNRGIILEVPHSEFKFGGYIGAIQQPTGDMIDLSQGWCTASASLSADSKLDGSTEAWLGHDVIKSRSVDEHECIYSPYMDRLIELAPGETSLLLTVFEFYPFEASMLQGCVIAGSLCFTAPLRVTPTEIDF